MRSNNPILKIDNLNKSFGGVAAIQSITLDIPQGRIVSLIGPNGAGKTTLFNVINGFIPPDHGHISYNSHPITHKKPWQIARLGIGRLFQDLRVLPKLTVLENVMIAFKDQPGENPIFSLFRPFKTYQIHKSLQAKAHEWLDFVGLSEHIKKPAENLSYGQQKLLVIARLLTFEADLLLLDEPASGVHPKMLVHIGDFIRKLVSEFGKTVLIIEHILSFVRDISDTVHLLDDGQLISSGKPDDVLKNGDMRRAYLGI